MVIHGRARSGVNWEAAALKSIMTNNGNTGGVRLDGLLSSSLGINRAQLVAVREMGP